MAVAVIALAAPLAVAGCGSADPPTSPGTAAPSLTGAAPTPEASKPPQFAKMRFSASTYACKPKATPQVKGSWETKAPRYPVKPGTPIKLGLSNSGGAHTPVLAVVYTRSGAHAYAHAERKGSWANAVFPKDFVVAKSHHRMKGYHTGVYTVVWLTQQGHKFISCDGFATVGANTKEPSHKRKQQHSGHSHHSARPTSAGAASS